MFNDVICIGDEVVIVTTEISKKIVKEIKGSSIVVEQYKLKQKGEIYKKSTIKEYPIECVIGIGKALL